MMQRLELRRIKLITYVRLPPETKSFLMKFLFRINGGINFYFSCWGNRIVREQYVVITSGLAAVALFYSLLFCSKTCGRGVRTV